MKTLLEQVSLILTYAGITQGVFVALLLNNKRVRKSRANVFLSVLMGTLSFSIAHILYAAIVINHHAIRVYSFGDPTYFVIAPLLWFYILALTGEKVAFSWRMLVHFLPFLLIILLSVSLHSISPATVSFLNAHHISFTIPFWIGMVVQFSCYQYFIHKKWMAYQEKLRQEVSNTEDVSISWVRFFMGVFLVVNVFFLFSLFAVIHLDSRLWLPKATALTFSLSVFALGYKGILQKEILNMDFSAAPTPPLPEPKESNQDPELVRKVIAYMEEKKPFIDPELTLSSLAADLNMSRSQLSQLINNGIGDNFYDFVNKYRVEQVKKLMSNPKMNHYTMLGLALEAGFKSKSTFNLIFKRFTGLTPTEYRKNLSQKGP